MIKFIQDILKLLKTPEVYALVIGIPVFLKALAKFLELIGKIIPGDDFVETSSNKIKRFVAFIIKILDWLGVGNGKKRNT